MKPFTRNEILGVSIILVCLGAITFKNMQVAIRRSRDSQRRADLGAISNALNKYQQDFGFFPPSEDGKIKACKGANFELVIKKFKEKEFNQNKFFTEALTTCEWGEDSLTDLGLFENGLFSYLKAIPRDSKYSEGVSYLYLSNTKRYQLYAYLEGEESEDTFNPDIVERDLECGNKVCSFGKSFADTPLDKSIEEYEQELLEELNTGGVRL
jgi:type II secretory pathway pseudopilin PulG